MKSIVKSQIETTIKQEAEVILANYGITTAQAIRLLFHQIAQSKSFPLSLQNQTWAPRNGFLARLK